MTEMTFEMTDEIEERLTALARRNGLSIGEAIRRGLCLLSIADRELRQGNSLAVIHGQEDKVETIYLLDDILC